MPQRNSKPLRGPSSAEYQHLLDENDALRLQRAKLRSDLKRKQQTITKLIEIINKDEDMEKTGLGPPREAHIEKV